MIQDETVPHELRRSLTEQVKREAQDLIKRGYDPRRAWDTAIGRASAQCRTVFAELTRVKEESLPNRAAAESAGAASVA
jgi:hypothetical protein